MFTTVEPQMPPGPRQRVIRTTIQVVLAVAVALPAAVALLPVDAKLAAQITSIAGAAVILISAIQNGLEGRTGRDLP